MDWPEGLRSDTTPGADKVVLRLAFYLHHRLREPAAAERVLGTARISRKTLTRYTTYEPPTLAAGGDLHDAGPRRLDLYVAICQALGENPGRVLWAASVAGDYPSMLAILHAEVRLRPRLVVADPQAAQFELLPAEPAGASLDPGAPQARDVPPAAAAR